MVLQTNFDYVMTQFYQQYCREHTDNKNDLIVFFGGDINNKFGIWNDAFIPYLFSCLCPRLKALAKHDFSASILSAMPKHRRK